MSAWALWVWKRGYVLVSFYSLHVLWQKKIISFILWKSIFKNKNLTVEESSEVLDGAILLFLYDLWDPINIAIKTFALSYSSPSHCLGKRRAHWEKQGRTLKQMQAIDYFYFQGFWVNLFAGSVQF